MRIYTGMKFSEGKNRIKMADIIAKYDQHFLGQTREFFERFQFNRRDQASGEQSMSTSQFCETCLKRVVSVTTCEIFWSWTTCSWA